MTSRFAKDPYSVSFQEVDSRVSASLKAEADLKRKTEKLQKELQTNLLAHHREKIQLQGFLAELHSPLGPRVVRTRKHSMGHGVASRTVTRKLKSEPTRRFSEPFTPVDDFLDFRLRDPFAWDNNSDDSDHSSDLASVYISKKAPEIVPEPNLTTESKGQGRMRKASVWKFPKSDTNRLPLINAPSSKSVKASSSPRVHCPTLSPVQTGASNSDVEGDRSPEPDQPRLTISTLANLQTGTSDVRKRIQRWCENISVEFFPFAENEKSQNSEVSKGVNGRKNSDISTDCSTNPPLITVTDVNTLPYVENPSINNNNKTLPVSPQQPLAKSHFFPRSAPKYMPSCPVNLAIEEHPSSCMQPFTPASPWKSSKAPSSRRDSTGKIPVPAPRRPSTVTATDLRVISKSMQSHHACKVYRGHNSIPTAGSNPKVQEDLARAQQRLVQRQKVRARQNGNSFDFGEMRDPKIKMRNSARWSL